MGNVSRRVSSRRNISPSSCSPPPHLSSDRVKLIEKMQDDFDPFVIDSKVPLKLQDQAYSRIILLVHLGLRAVIDHMLEDHPMALDKVQEDRLGNTHVVT